MIRVIALCPFHDLAAKGKLREIGDKWDCSEERAQQLAALRLVAVSTDQPEEEKAPSEGDANQQPADEGAPAEEEKAPAKAKSSARKAK